MEWAAVFDERYPLPGATNAVIEQFVDEVNRPLSDDEIREINTSQRNPFPPTDRLHSVWCPFDASGWTLPDRSFPPMYLSLLRWSDGGEFRTGSRWFQFFPALGKRNGVRAMTMAYQIPEYMPGATPFAFNGGGTFYLFDMRKSAVDGEYPVICAHAGYLSWDPEACYVLANRFEDACRGTIKIDELRHAGI